MKNILIFIIVSSCLFMFSSCKINQHKNGQKVGRWVYKDKFMGVTSKSKGRYKNDFEVGTWKHYDAGKLVAKHVYKDSICYTTEYHTNGKIQAFGVSKMIIEKEHLHWFVTGEWKFYASDGQFLGSKYFDKGNFIKETQGK